MVVCSFNRQGDESRCLELVKRKILAQRVLFQPKKKKQRVFTTDLCGTLRILPLRCMVNYRDGEFVLRMPDNAQTKLKLLDLQTLGKR